MSEHLELWNRLSKTDPSYVKEGKGKAYKYTAVDPMYVVMRLTEELGPMGVGWGYEETGHEIVTLGSDDKGRPDTVFLIQIKAWVQIGDKRAEVTHRAGWPFCGKNTGYRVDEDAPTKALTHVIKKAFSLWGLCADVFMGEFEDAGYAPRVAAEIKAEEARNSEEQMLKRLDSLLKSNVGCESEDDELAMLRYAIPELHPSSAQQVRTTKGLPGKAYSAIVALQKKNQVPYHKLLSIAKGQA